MRKYLVILLLVCPLFVSGQSTHQITASGFMYMPDSLVIQVGDAVEFSVGATHPTVEVSKESWEANEATPLANGFSAPSGTETIAFSEAGTFYYVCENHISSGMKGRIFVEAATGINDMKSRDIDNLEIYPNPLQHYAFLDFNLLHNENITIALYNLLGSKVKTFYQSKFPAGSYHISLNFSELPHGVYYVNIETNNISKSLKIIK